MGEESGTAGESARPEMVLMVFLNFLIRAPPTKTARAPHTEEKHNKPKQAGAAKTQRYQAHSEWGAVGRGTDRGSGTERSGCQRPEQKEPAPASPPKGAPDGGLRWRTEPNPATDTTSPRREANGDIQADK